MKKRITTLLLTLVTLTAMTQELTQTIRGTIKDADSDMGLIGVNILCMQNGKLTGTITEVDGTFRLDDIPTGRATIQVSYIGYEEKVIPNIVVNSAKEVILNLTLSESAMKMDEIVIVAHKEKGKPRNEMVLLSGRSISPEETNRYAGGFNDPSRIVSNFAGVASTQDGGNDIIVRGNSPKYMQWRLEGMQITNPNHFGDQSAIGGSISTLNNNLLDNSDFYTGAFSAEYGDVLSGVYDVKLRSGNNEQTEAVFGFGILGMDLTLEGPIKKDYGGSYLINYRYSTAGLADDLGLLGDIGGVPIFQDAAFKLLLPSKKLGVFSIYGLGGKSNFIWEDVKPDSWVTPGNAFQRPEIIEDFNKDAHLYNVGVNHSINIYDNAYIKTGVLYSAEGIEDEIFHREYALTDGLPNLDSLKDTRLNFQNDLIKTTLRISTAYHHKFSARHKLEMGSKYARFGYDVNQSMLDPNREGRKPLLDFNENIATMRNYISWKYRMNDKLTLITGLHNMNVLFNNKSTLESRWAIRWQPTKSSQLNIGYGEHSTMESIHNYFTIIQLEDGTTIEPNRDLDLLKARHFVMGYEKKIGQNIRAKLEAYYQDLYNLPVENDENSSYATINESLDFQYVDLVNAGVGKNYGIEFTLERYFQNNYYYLVNASLYESKYTALDGIERDTRYNGNFIFNVLMGKEYTGLGRKRNQTLGINMKAFYGGGKRITPLLRNDQDELDINPSEDRYYDEANPYSTRLEDLYQINLSASYKWNKKKTTHELFLNIDNITNHKGKISEYYDVEQEGAIGNLTQFGIFPNLMYRLYF